MLKITNKNLNYELKIKYFYLFCGSFFVPSLLPPHPLTPPLSPPSLSPLLPPLPPPPPTTTTPSPPWYGKSPFSKNCCETKLMILIGLFF